MSATHDQNPEPLTAEQEQESEADNRADAKTILVMFAALVLFAVHFASGWSFDF